MSYTGLRATGRNATADRPADSAQAVPGDTWFKDRSGPGKDDGTELDATFANRVKALLEAMFALGGDPASGDDQLADAVAAYVADQIAAVDVAGLEAAIDALTSALAGKVAKAGDTLTGTLKFLAADNLTAHAGGGKGSALALTAQFNRIATVASAADSVLLPASAAGLWLIVTNDGANAMQVFGAGTDTINGVATGTGISHAAGITAIYQCSVVGKWNASATSTPSSSDARIPGTTTANNLPRFTDAGGTLGESAVSQHATTGVVSVAATSGFSALRFKSQYSQGGVLANDGSSVFMGVDAGTDGAWNDGIQAHAAHWVALVSNGVNRLIASASGLLQIAGTSSSYPALKRDGAALRMRLADDSADTHVIAKNTCKAWVKFAGATGAIDASFNVTSVTRNATGDYTIAFTSAFSDTHYTLSGVGKHDSLGAWSNAPTIGIQRVSGAQATGSCRISTTIFDHTLADSESITVQFFGN